MILVDTNVLLDVVTDDPAWAVWSLRQLNAAALRDRLDNGRKVAIQILEFFDAAGMTTRDGDLRRALNALEVLVLGLPEKSAVTAADLEVFARERRIRYDADEDEHARREHGDGGPLHLACLDLLAEILRRASHHQARDENADDHEHQHAVQARADAAEDHLPKIGRAHV